MKIGKTTYDDNAVYHMGQVWPRGNGYITDPNTGKKYSEGDRNLPWENNKV
jgi:glycogen debranching enzyme